MRRRRSDSLCNLVVFVRGRDMCHPGAGVHCTSTTSRVSARRVDAGPRGALSPWCSSGSVTRAAWGTSGSCLQPFRLLGQQGAASSYVETPTWKNRRALDQGSRGHVPEVLDMHPPGSGAENISPGPPGKKEVSASISARKRRVASSVAHIATQAGSTLPTCTTPAKTQPRAVFGARISLVHPKHASLAYATRGG